MIPAFPASNYLLGKEASKVIMRACLEFTTQWPLLCEKWKFILLCVAFQYLHGVGAKSAHYLHRPGPLLHDLGFELLPELGGSMGSWSERVFLMIIVPFIVWTFHPFFCNNKRFYTTLIWHKCLIVICFCQILRIASFTATQLPGPNYHCREGSPLATLPPLTHFYEVFIVKLSQAHFGCGDLIFSSHMTFTITAVMAYLKYGSLRLIKAMGFLLLVIQSLLIVASRKHYTVDIVVAWYTVPLMFYFVDNYFSEYGPYGESMDTRFDRLVEKTLSAPILPIKVDLKTANGHSEHFVWGLKVNAAHNGCSGQHIVWGNGHFRAPPLDSDNDSCLSGCFRSWELTAKQNSPLHL